MFRGVVVQHLGTPLSNGTALNRGVAIVYDETDAVARFFPRGAEDHPTPQERQVITAPSRVSIPDAVTVVRCDSDVRAWFWENVAARVCAPDGEIAPEERRRCLWEFGQRVAGGVAAAGLRAVSIRSCDVQITPPNAASTSFDYRSGRYVGLHVDDHDHLMPSKRRSAFQLLCLNVGRAERYLHFVNVAVPDMIAALRGKVNIAPRTPVRDIVAAFFTAFRDYPIVRVTLPPDYGYLAVTQYVVHDGAPNARGEADVAFLMAGTFALA